MDRDQDYDLIIKEGESELNYWRDIIEYKELFLILAWRDLKIRYQQTFIGLAWSFLRPLLTMLAFTLIFSRIAALPSSGNAPYAIMVFAGLLPWQFFASALNESSQSLIMNQNLITKVYFPRIIIPVSNVLTNLVDMLIALILLFVLMLYYGYAPSWHLLLLPFFIVLIFMFSIGLGLLVASFNIQYRDFKYVVPFMVQLGLFISPVGFSSQVIPEEWQLIYSFNPLVGIIDGFRWVLLQGSTTFRMDAFAISVLISIGLFVIGIYSFRKVERKITDII